LVVYLDHLEMYESGDLQEKCITLGLNNISITGPCALSFTVNIPVPGRYRIEIESKTKEDKQSIIWLEDYVNNQDDRTYNITGNMVLSANDTFDFISKDGSPLDHGSHQMKLHADHPVMIKGIKFVLLKKTYRISKDSYSENNRRSVEHCLVR
jgi:hypothetical protein